MIGGALISEGGYGCIYHPDLIDNSEKYVSKVQLKNSFAYKNEIFISNTLKNIKGIKDFFGLVETSHSIDIGKLKDECSITKKYKSNQFGLMKIEYVGKYNYQEYLLNLNKNPNALKNAFLYWIETYKRLLKGISILKDNNLVHFDLKDNNIIFNETKKIPIIIDFGLSIPLDNIMGNLENYFYVYAPDYYYWPLEVHYLNFIINKSSKPTNDDIEVMANLYVNGNTVLQENFSTSFQKKYENECLTTLKTYQKMNDVEVINYILKSATTWDNYSLSILFLKYLKIFNPSGFVKNSFISYFTSLLLKNIHPNPKKRDEAEKTLEKFEFFFYDEKINNTKNFLEILENLIIIHEEINIALKKDMKELKRVNRLIYTGSR